jgi:glycogen synthase
MKNEATLENGLLRIQLQISSRRPSKTTSSLGHTEGSVVGFMLTKEQAEELLSTIETALRSIETEETIFFMRVPVEVELIHIRKKRQLVSVELPNDQNS